MGALAAILVLAANIAVEPTASFADVRNGIALVNKWLLTPSLLIVLVSGLLAIAATNAYKDAGWADAMMQVTDLLRTEWGAVWMMLFLGLVNIVLAIWRPRFTRRREAASGAASS